jgi:hypothetical protein
MPNDGKEHVGLIAQALQQVAPTMVGTARRALTPGGAVEDILTNEGSGTLLYVLMNSIKELHTRCETLETTLAHKEAPPCDRP